MFFWSFIIFGLGILAFFDSQYNYGFLFRTIHSTIFMLISLGILVKTRISEKKGTKEKLIKKIEELEAGMLELQALKESGESEKSRLGVTV
jgi:hypothetical protein